jgi:Protein of unknown function (DUF3551)
MRKTLFGVTVVVGVVASIFFTAGVASADPYKWRAVYNVGDSAYNCGFVTAEQCRATVSGIGGFCEPNQFYNGPDTKPAKRARKQAPSRLTGGATVTVHRVSV